MSQAKVTEDRLTGWRAGLVWLVVGIELALAGLGAILVPEQPDLPVWARFIFALIIGSLGIVGALVATRQPRNAIGWILWASAISLAVAVAGDDYATYSVAFVDGDLPATIWVAWLSGLAALPAFIAALIFVPLLFPDGHLLSPRWRWVVLLAVTALIVQVVPAAFVPGPLDAVETLTNPVGIGAAAALKDALDTANILGFGLVLPLAVVSVVLRYQRGTSIEREQLKWFGAAVALVGACFGLALVPAGWISELGWLSGIVSISLIPIAIGVAILRYRLYEIDRIISRTLSYAVVTATLALVFVGAVLGLQAVLEPFTGENTIAVAASTLVAAALFQPLRRRVQHVVDRRFNRARYDAQHMAEAFAESLRDEVEITADLRHHRRRPRQWPGCEGCRMTSDRPPGQYPGASSSRWHRGAQCRRGHLRGQLRTCRPTRRYRSSRRAGVGRHSLCERRRGPGHPPSENVIVAADGRRTADQPDIPRFQRRGGPPGARPR
jgi:hypothetical protein